MSTIGRYCNCPTCTDYRRALDALAQAGRPAGSARQPAGTPGVGAGGPPHLLPPA